MVPRGNRWLVGGGIGTGKSAVGEVLEDLGWIVIDADRVGHDVLDGQAAAEVLKRWPGVGGAGRVDRRMLARLVFSDLDQLRMLEEITHPEIRQRILEMTQNADRVAVEVPIAGSFLGPGWFQVTVDAPLELRRQRLLDRGMEPADIDRRMAAQPSQDLWLAQADATIWNGGELEELRRDVVTLVESCESE